MALCPCDDGSVTPADRLLHLTRLGHIYAGQSIDYVRVTVGP